MKGKEMKYACRANQFVRRVIDSLDLASRCVRRQLII